MKKVCLIASIAIISLSANLSAQGAFGKLKEKLNSAAVPKGAYYYYYENIGKQEKAKELLVTEKFSVVDENNLATKGTSKYDPDKNYKKIELPGMQQPVFNDGNYHNTIIKIQDDVYLKVYFQGEACEMKFLNTLEVFSTNKEFIKEIQKDDKCENYKKLEVALDNFIKADAAKDAAKKAEGDKAEAKENATYELPLVSGFVPAGVTQKVIADAFYTKHERAVDAGSLKLTYAYFGSHKIRRLKPQKEWQIIKEKKLVNGTYDDVVTKRTLDVICVIQNDVDIKNDTYSLKLIQIYEDAAFGIYDGSKFTGKYYFNDFGASADMYKPKDRMMKYKDVLK